MPDAEDTRSTPPPAEPSPPAAPPPGAGPPKKGMSTGAKVAIGCGAALVVGLVVLAVVVVAGGWFVKNKADEFVGGMEAQVEATETIQRLEREHPFSPPADGVVGEERAERFLAVTDDAWKRMGDRVEELVERAERAEDRGRAGVGDVMAGMRGFGGARIALAEALTEHEMPVSEYLWTGLTLLRAYEELEMPTGAGGVPAANLALADEHREELAEIAEEDEDGRPDRSVVLAMAWTLGASEEAVRGGLGLDTLGGWVP